MRYTIVRYGYPNQLNDVLIPIGIIVQGDNVLKYRFDLNKEKFEKIKQIIPNADPDTFFNYEKSFEENFVKPGKILTSDGLGNKVEINITELAFLQYLNSTFLGSYSYSNPTAIEGNDIDKILDYLYKSIVGE